MHFKQKVEMEMEKEYDPFPQYIATEFLWAWNKSRDGDRER